MIDKMLIRGAKVHNLKKNIGMDIPLGTIAASSLPEDIRANTGSITGRYL